MVYESWLTLAPRATLNAVVVHAMVTSYKTVTDMQISNIPDEAW